MNALNKKCIIIVLLLLGWSAVSTAQFSPATPIAGKQNTQDYIQQNLRYPEQALESGLSGEVVVAFHLDGQGQGSGYHVTSSFCEAANTSSIDLVRKILWHPAQENMKPVATDMEYRIEYKAKSYKRYWRKRERALVPLTLEADTSYRIYDPYHLEEAAKPYFADGSNMGQYLLSNLHYPESAKAGEISGTVRLTFVVEADGSISNIVIKESVGGGCDNEAVRLMQETHWIPAVKNGKYVRSRNEQDITFHFGARNYQDGNGY